MYEMKRSSLIITMLAFGLVLVMALPVVAAAQGKIGLVNMQKAVTECEEGKKANAKIRQHMEKVRTDLKKMQDEMIRLKSEYNNTVVLLKPEARSAKLSELRRMEDDMRVKQRDAEREFKYLRDDAFQPIVRKMQVVIQAMGVEGGYSLIVPHTAVVWAPASTDITDQVIAAYNKAHP